MPGKLLVGAASGSVPACPRPAAPPEGGAVPPATAGGFARAGPAIARSVSAVREPQLVVAQMEHVALVDALVVDAHALVVDAVRRPEVLDIERAVAANHRRVLARDVAVLDR